MKHDQLEKWEQIPLGLLMAAQGLVVFRWYAGEQLPDLVRYWLPWVTTLFAILAAVALDLVVVTTTMGRREGRESFWSWCTAGAAALFSAGVALDVYGGLSAGPYLHVAYPAVTFVYMQHLAQPKKSLQRSNPSAGPMFGETEGDELIILAQSSDAEIDHTPPTFGTNGTSNGVHQRLKYYECKACGAGPLTFQELGRHARLECPARNAAAR